MAIYYNNGLNNYYYGGNFFGPSNVTGKIYYGNVLVNGGYNSYDDDASSFIFAAGISGSTADAVNTLVVSLKNNSLWNEMYAIYPFVGGTSNSCKYNLKNVNTYTLVETGSTGTITYDNLGVTFPGDNDTTAKVLDTGFIDTGSSWLYNDASMGYYTNLFVSRSGVAPYIIGCNSSVSPYTVFGNTAGDGSGGDTYGTVYAAFMRGSSPLLTGNALNESPDNTGYYAASVFSNLELRERDYDVAFGAGVTEAYTGLSILIGGVRGRRSFQGRMAFAYLGQYLNGTQQNTLYNIIQTFQTSLSRNSTPD